MLLASMIEPQRAAIPVIIRPATLDDAVALSALGAATFRDTFEADNTPEDMARYLSTAFNPEQQAAEINDPESIILLAARTSATEAELVGYAHVVAGSPPQAVESSNPVELKRLYVARSWHGRGVAHMLMDAVLAAAQARGAETVWLGVWERNPRAVAFYRKYGFEHVGEQTFQLGSDRQTDWILARPTSDGRQE
jgi:ribosomal protein S18 acetylase RimI-like enzyme